MFFLKYGLVLKKIFVQKIGISCKLQPRLLKQKRFMMKFMKTLGKLRKMSCYLILKAMFYRPLSVMPDSQK